MQLNKYIADAGICSRRKAVELIKEGLVTVNGTVVKEPGYRVKSDDMVKYKNKIVRAEEQLYLLLNKPKDYITTVSDERGRKTVMDLVRGATKKRLYPVGRLDRETTGLLLLTNDGALAQKLAHPRYEIKKVYYVVLDRLLEQGDVAKIKKGLKFRGGKVTVDRISYVVGKRRNTVRVTVHSGKNRIVRRIFEYLGYDVQKLDRINYAGLTKKGIPLGRWRFLDEKEIKKLKEEAKK